MPTIPEAIEYVNLWRTVNGIAENIKLTEDQFLKFAKDLQLKIGEFSFKSSTAPDANVIPSSGMIGDTPAWKVAKATSRSSGGKFIFIGDTPAGQLIYDGDFICAVIKAVGEDEVLADRLINGKRTGISDKENEGSEEEFDKGIDWKEINFIIENKSSKGSWSSSVHPEEMTSEDYSKISFLLKEVNGFPDNQKTVAQSAEILRKHLSEKYCMLSSKSISLLINTFCMMNR